MRRDDGLKILSYESRSMDGSAMSGAVATTTEPTAFASMKTFVVAHICAVVSAHTKTPELMALRLTRCPIYLQSLWKNEYVR
ncbi:hypothetical protein F2Q70_00002424 [Brassica cretica]|uniref:Uncharacterized protein n=1 Tax=Brassica cretica TaxID=69181 RepID=A0A8S9IZJ5_BRACR|nr:hypothetical protein F2Q70_00002424 [Brassica cretica]KAF3561687.1 hypothetical protein DY000_02013860 [Brassica cretica]